MYKEEKYIRNKFGREEHFRVPEGYFDDFTSRLMANLPEQEAKIVEMCPQRRAKLRVISIAAASVCAVMLSLGTYLGVNRHDSRQIPSASVSIADAQRESATVDAMANYTMLDNEDMYNYLADNH